jgi:hypothetical protein
MMSRKDYQAIADVFAQAALAEGMSADWAHGANCAREYIAHHLASVMQVDNPRFDRQRFYVAAGVS